MKMERKKKIIIATTASLIFILSAMAPMFIIKANTDQADWYKTVSGVLDNDYYALYPYNEKSLTIGFSKFGEMVDLTTGTGLNYSGKDPFANEGVNMVYWLQGWFIDIRYVHRTYGARHIWAMATFADMVSYGGDWINNATDPYGEPHGGRKCSGSAITEPIKVLYDGPRRFVALLVTHINDTTYDSSWPVVDVMFTIIFNKVKKEVIILKDVKLKIDAKILETPVNVQFSNRGEWDLGPSPDWKSYAHFYHQELRTCFGANWHLSKNITREYHYVDATFHGNTLTLPEDTPKTGYYFGYPVAQGSEYVYVNDVWMRPGTDYNINYETGTITFTQSWPENTKVEVYYKLYKHYKNEQDNIIALPNEYDLAQIISRDMDVVGFSAFWPVLSDYTVDGWDRALEPLYNVSEPDMLPVGTGEPDIPFVIGEWDFLLDYDVGTPNWGDQFRGVTVYGVTDRWNGEDAQHDCRNVVDKEVQYQLDEIFNPWDLQQAVTKNTRRHVWIEDVVNLNSVTLPEKPFRLATWDAYNSFAERVLLNGTLLKPTRAGGTNYTVTVNSNGYGTISFPEPVTGHLKILYSTNTTYTNNNNIYFTTSDHKDFSKTGVSFTYSNPTWGDSGPLEDPLGVTYRYTIKSFTFKVSNTTNISGGEHFSLVGTSDWYAEHIKVFKENSAILRAYWIGGYSNNKWIATGTGNNINVTITEFILDVNVTPPEKTDVHIDWIHLDADYNVTALYDATNNYWNVTINITVTGQGLKSNQLYIEHIPGRYEWTVVGNHSRALDSTGAALVSAAFKNKQVEIGVSGLDMPDITWGPKIPYLLSNLSYSTWRVGGPAWTNWYDCIGRLALRDDWCTTWPVSSANIISVGGPAADLATEYFNEFTEAFQIYGVVPPLTDSNLVDSTFALTCWSKNSYKVEFSNGQQTKGYAVIATYEDLNGTVGLVIYGWTGQDTYYASKWFHEEGIYELQEFPSCVTSIILEIDYTVHNPTFENGGITIVECLGPISETLVENVKGGIHPDP